VLESRKITHQRPTFPGWHQPGCSWAHQPASCLLVLNYTSFVFI